MNTTTRTARRSSFTFYLLPFTFLILFLLAAAAPSQAETPDELIRRANDVFRAGDKVTADRLYTLAEERATDPGLVAFNRGAVLFDRKSYREAELCYERALKDGACPPERAAKAWYNRGTCLLYRGGTIEVYRAAIACFEHTLDSAAADEQLKGRAADNLELAKLLWAEERKKAENAKKSPNMDVPPEEDGRPKPQPAKKGSTDPDPDNQTNQTTKDKVTPKDGSTQPQQNSKTATKPTETEKKIAGNNAGLEVLKDEDKVQSLSEKDARANLAETAKRIKREQESLLRSLYPPERPTVRDW